jgi:hypothetical protein
MLKPKSILASLAGLIATQRSAAAEFGTNLEAIREQISDLQRQRVEVETSAPDDAAVKARAAEIVALMADQARTRVMFEIVAASDADYSAERFIDLLSTVHGQAHGSEAPFAVKLRQVLSPFHLEALLRPDALASMIYGEAARHVVASGVATYSTAKREAECARLTDEVGQLERAEELLCRAAEGAGLPCERRVDAPARWLLAPDAELQAAA